MMNPAPVRLELANEPTKASARTMILTQHDRFEPPILPFYHAWGQDGTQGGWPFPAEPAPEEGSLAHALERLLPTSALLAGYSVESLPDAERI
jgi:hypothetical protein